MLRHMAGRSNDLARLALQLGELDCFQELMSTYCTLDMFVYFTN
jgi:hypothetical protein